MPLDPIAESRGCSSTWNWAPSTKPDPSSCWDGDSHCFSVFFMYFFEGFAVWDFLPPLFFLSSLLSHLLPHLLGEDVCRPCCDVWLSCGCLFQCLSLEAWSFHCRPFLRSLPIAGAALLPAPGPFRNPAVPVCP